jgi:hypothetical protein
VSWNFDLTSVAEADFVGLEPAVHKAAMGAIASWAMYGPPLEGDRNVGGMILYEAVVAERYSMAYVVSIERQHFAILWLRERPIGAH